jgi:bifunctional UDP-N-acetylglucosamine pyrophosphorylase/glucosamine-1-phosphate N-acetyltransferase
MMVVEPRVQVLVLAAGKGTRMRSETAKVLHAALGLPLLEHVLRAVEPLGGGATVVVGHEGETVRQAFAARQNVTFVPQEPQLGTGHAVQVASAGLRPDLPVLVVYGDTPLLTTATLEGLIAAHDAARGSAALLSARLDDAGAYGRVVRSRDGSLERIVESSDASAEELALREINAGVYVFDVGRLLERLGALEAANAQGELFLTDLVGLLVQDGEKVAVAQVSDPTEVMGVNTQAELAEASRLLRDRRLRALMLEGVVVEDPATTWVGLDCLVEPGAVLRPSTIVEGNSVVRSGARVGPFVRLVAADVGAGAEVLDHCLVRDSRIGPGAMIGPFAHIRPESVVGERAKVGNFVELKKTRLGDGAKAPHLTYLGDAVVGERSNIGAGTITCNYDGTAKHPTEIGPGAFVGSHSTLVAPIRIGAGAYVGAGSTLTDDVPEDALALGRARQVVKPEWAARRRRAREQR